MAGRAGVRVLDLFCGEGGAAMGLHRAWPDAEIIGVDINPMPKYPFTFVQADAMTYPLEGFDFIWSSPPCQGYSIMRNLPWLRDRDYPMLIPATRKRLEASGAHWIIENVAGSKRSAKHPEGLVAGWLCGSSFGLPIFRHRYFESSFLWLQPPHAPHDAVISPGRMLGNRAREPVAARKTGHKYGFDRPGAAVCHGNAAGMSAKKALDVPWMSRDGATQAVPPAYSEYLAKQCPVGVPA